MIELIALTFALVFACFLLVFVMHQAFVRGVGWFDERDTRRELERRRRRQQRLNQTRPRAEVKAAVRPARPKDEDEWSEFIDV
ncbi:MAG: hypothetical protein MSG64_13110 [Pyrinomonadaceae bacterium MAG19_C2-C3]|nr:hypothetical protein [Pyrinomonadaceae bacterium MAG19_C2-C3]